MSDQIYINLSTNQGPALVGYPIIGEDHHVIGLRTQGHDVLAPARALLAHSPMLRQVLSSRDFLPLPFDTPVVSLPNVKVNVVKHLVALVTTGKTNTSHQEVINEIEGVMEMLQIDGGNLEFVDDVHPRGVLEDDNRGYSQAGFDANYEDNGDDVTLRSGVAGRIGESSRALGGNDEEPSADVNPRGGVVDRTEEYFRAGVGLNDEDNGANTEEDSEYVLKIEFKEENDNRAKSAKTCASSGNKNNKRNMQRGSNRAKYSEQEQESSDEDNESLAERARRRISKGVTKVNKIIKKRFQCKS